MTREKINEYAVRISGSSRGELVAISCEIAVQFHSFQCGYPEKDFSSPIERP